MSAFIPASKLGCIYSLISKLRKSYFIIRSVYNTDKSDDSLLRIFVKTSIFYSCRNGLVNFTEIVYFFTDWDRPCNSSIALTQMLPPTARGKKGSAREKTRNLVKKLIVVKNVHDLPYNY